MAVVEHASMRIASAIGIPTTKTGTIKTKAGTAFLTERFDRSVKADGKVSCIRVEDLGQALGVSSKDKYEPRIKDVVSLFQRNGVGDDVIYRWLRMVAFNIGIGNWDAHAKNYSVFLNEQAVSLCPLYDSLSMAHWRSYRYDSMPMGVNDVFDAWEVTLDDWRYEAEQCGLDDERVASIVCDVEQSLVELDYNELNVDKDIAKEIRDFTRECGRDLLPDVERACRAERAEVR